MAEVEVGYGRGEEEVWKGKKQVKGCGRGREYMLLGEALLLLFCSVAGPGEGSRVCKSCAKGRGRGSGGTRSGSSGRRVRASPAPRDTRK